MKRLSYLLILLFIFQLAGAAEFKQEFDLKDKETNVIINIDYEKESEFNFYLELPKDAKEIKIYLDDQKKKFNIREAELTNFVNIFGKAENVKIEYLSANYIDRSSKYYFTAEVIPVLDGNLEIKVVLPEGAVLDKPYTAQGSSSIYPKPSKLESNGKNLIIIWNEDAKSYESFPLFLVYNYSKFNYYILLASLILIALIAFFVFKTIKKRKLKIKKIKVDDIDSHLKDDEKLIVNILKQKKGSCNQSTLLTLSNMSKASLSRLLQELEQRKIIKKEQKGNKNLIVLKRK